MLILLGGSRGPLGCTGFYVRGHVASTDKDVAHSLGFHCHPSTSSSCSPLCDRASHSYLRMHRDGSLVSTGSFNARFAPVPALPRSLGALRIQLEVRRRRVHSGVLPLDACSRLSSNGGIHVVSWLDPKLSPSDEPSLRFLLARRTVCLACSHMVLFDVSVV